MPQDVGVDELLSSSTIAKWLGNSRSQAWRLMDAGAFGTVIDISAPGAHRSHLRVYRSAVQSWLDSRQLKAG